MTKTLNKKSCLEWVSNATETTGSKQERIKLWILAKIEIYAKKEKISNAEYINRVLAEHLFEKEHQ